MFNLIRQYALPVIGVQFVILLLLGYFLYGSYTQWEVETKVERDTTVVTETDTVWGGFDLGFQLEELEADTTLTKAKKDTVVKDSIVYVNTEPATRLYNESFSRTLSSGTVISGVMTSKVRGYLVDQSLSITGDVPAITEYKTRTITKTVTNTQVGKWRVVGSLDGFYGDGKMQIVAPGIGLQRPTEFSVFYKYDLANGYHGVSINFPLSLLF